MDTTASLKRTLTLWPVVLFGLAYMAPMTIFTTYGVATQASRGMLPAAYVVALAAMIFTAYSYGQMVKAYPVSGSAYTYTQKSFNPYLGFLVGWAILMDYLFLPMINFLVAGLFLSAAFPEVPSSIWIISFILLITAINIIGIRLTTNINMILIGYQFLVIILFVALSLQGIFTGKGTGTLFSSLPFFNPEVSFSYVLAAASILCLSFLGFDAVTTLSEETIDSKRNIPRAILLVTLLGGGLFIFVSYIAHMVFPNYETFVNPDSAAFEVAAFIGGNVFSAVFLAGMITATFASGLSSHASVARLLYAMGRDNVIPRSVFGFIHSRFQTPVYNVVLVGVFSFSSLFVDLVTAASFINFGALVAFTFVNLSVIAHYYVKQQLRSPADTIRFLLLPAVGACFTLWLWSNLDRHSMMLGAIWAALGIVYLLYLTKMFKQRPPELHFEDSEPKSQAANL